jgi:hypothetical protein
MINIRYHVYSLVAVFLALAIGVAAGSTVVQRSVVDNLRSTQGRIEKNLDALEAENKDLQARTAVLEKRADSLSDAGPTTLLAGDLTRLPVVLVHVAGVESTALGRARNALKVAGATVIFDIEVKAASADPDTLTSLANTLGLPADTRHLDQVQQKVGGRIGSLLAAVRAEAPPPSQLPDRAPRAGSRPGNTSVGAETTDVTPTTEPQPSSAARALREYVNVLDDAGVVAAQGPLGDDGAVDASGAEVLVLGGQTKELDPVPLLRPMLEALADAGEPAALAADAPLKDPPGDGVKVHALVAEVRGDGRLRDRMSTVDVLGDFAGLAAMVLGLADLATGQVGDYGTGDGADALLPVRQP